MTSIRVRKQVRPRKALTPLNSFNDKVRQCYLIVDPYVLEQVTQAGCVYQVKSLGKNQSTVKLSLQHEQMPNSSDEETAFSFSSEQEAFRALSELGTPKQRNSRRKEKEESNVIRSPSPAMASDLMFDDSNAAPLRTRAESERIFEEIIDRKRTMQLTGRPGAPINISDQAFAQCLEVPEFELCCFLRITPIQYYHSRDTLVRNLYKQGFYKKSAAQKMLRIDVNKTGRIYDFCIENRWLPRDEYDFNSLSLPALPKGVEQYF